MDWIDVGVIAFSFVAGMAFWEFVVVLRDKPVKRDERGRFTKG